MTHDRVTLDWAGTRRGDGTTGPKSTTRNETKVTPNFVSSPLGRVPGGQVCKDTTYFIQTEGASSTDSDTGVGDAARSESVELGDTWGLEAEGGGRNDEKEDSFRCRSHPDRPVNQTL